MNDAGITEIGLDRGPCFGTCPVFRVVLHRAGSYRYDGVRYVEPLGVKKGTIPGYLFDRLAGACSDLSDCPIRGVGVGIMGHEKPILP